jgi:hypothetical protein
LASKKLSCSAVRLPAGGMAARGGGSGGGLEVLSRRYYPRRVDSLEETVMRICFCLLRRDHQVLYYVGKGTATM